MPGNRGRLGILAGSGELPWIGARAALDAGEDISIFYFTREEPPQDLIKYATPVKLLKIFSSVQKKMLEHRVSRLLLLGKANREELYKNSIFSFDFRLLYLLGRSKTQSDYNIFDLLAREFEKKGIKIISQKKYLKKLFLPLGRYGKKCSTAELEDISYGIRYAREMNRLDIGQTVVVGKKCILAVECAEGTDRCIIRGGELFHKGGAVVCKTAKEDHDTRFDIPVFGLSTIESMKKSGCRVLAVEASLAISVNPEEVIREAKRNNITIIALEPKNSDVSSLKMLNQKEAVFVNG